MGSTGPGRLGPMTNISREDLPYFKGVKPFKYAGEAKSPFFVFLKDTILPVLKRRFSILSLLAGFLTFKWTPYEYYFEDEKFRGLQFPEVDNKKHPSEIAEDLVKEVNYDFNEFLNRPSLQAYVCVPTSNPYCDFVLGAVTDDGKGFKKTYLCKDSGGVDIVRGMEIDVTCQKIKIGSIEKLGVKVGKK